MISKLFLSVNLFKNGPISSRILVKFYSTGSDRQKNEKEQIEYQGQETSSGDNKPGLVLGVYETDKKLELSPAAAEVDQRSGGKISRYLNEISSRLKPGKAFVVTDVVPEFGPVAISALGPKDAGYNELEALDESRENVRVMVGAGVRALAGRGARRVAADGGRAPDAAAEAAYLAAWRFEEFKSDKQPEIQLSLYGGGGGEGEGGGEGKGEGGGEGCWNTGAVYGRAQNWARYLSDMPANKMTPVDFAQAALDTLCPLGVQVAAHEREWLAARRLRALLAAAAGAAAPPLLLHCQYSPPGAAHTAPVLLAAAGVTFDSGGLCLRPAPEMRQHGSRAGAAAALAALRVLAEMKVPLPVACVVPLCENLAGAACMKVGDVLPTLSGVHVLVEDTCLAARLALADALVLGQALHRPALVLTLDAAHPHPHPHHGAGAGGAGGAEGAGGAFACFSNSAAAWRGVRAAGARAGDRAWRLPLWRCYERQLEDDPAVDLRNKGSGKASLCLGAAFLKKFVCGPWVHADVSCVSRDERGAASGRPTRALAAFLAGMARRDADKE